MTDRTFAVFTTATYDAGDVYDETFAEHARALLEPLRQKLIASGRRVSAVEEHSHYGMALSVDDSISGRVRVLLQVVDPWLLTLKRELGIVDRIRGAREEQVDDALVNASDAALGELGARAKTWSTPEDYERAASQPGRVEPGS